MCIKTLCKVLRRNDVHKVSLYLNDFAALVPPGRSRSPRRIKSLIVALGSLRRRRCVFLKPRILFSTEFPPFEVFDFEFIFVVPVM